MCTLAANQRSIVTGTPKKNCNQLKIAENCVSGIGNGMKLGYQFVSMIINLERKPDIGIVNNKNLDIGISISVTSD